MQQPKNGFTLIELSIVLIIIGLITSGILVGRTLIEAAEIRAQITQLQKFDLAVNTFRNKYNAIPGDLDFNAAAAYGFITRAGGQGHGNGNGIIEGCASEPRFGCEFSLFWGDLSRANLISDPISLAGDTQPTVTTNEDSYKYFPRSKLNNAIALPLIVDVNNKNWYFFVSINYITPGVGWGGGNPFLTVNQSYAIDSKIDDGKPLTGIAVADTVNFSIPKPLAPNPSQGPDYCVYNNAYNLTVYNAVFCYIAVKGQ